MNYKKILCWLIFVLFLMSFVCAERYIEYDVRDGELFFGGYTQGTTALTDVNAIGYVCASSDCGSVSTALWGGTALNSGSSDKLVLTYPTGLQSQYGYGVFFYKPGYVTWEQSGITYAGTKSGEQSNPTFSNTAYLTKAQMCRAQIDTFSVTNDAKPNMPLVVNVSASLDATTHAALNHAGPIDYIPSSLKDDYYSLWTNIALAIFDSSGNIVYNDNTDVLIEFSGEKRMSFGWTPAIADNYTAIVQSYVIDNKCMDSEPMLAGKDFSVLQDEPDGMCYTLLNNLSALPLFAQKNDIVTIDAEKLSNMAFGGNLFTLPTTLTLEIYDNSWQLLHTEVKHVNANADTSSFEKAGFQWQSTVNGMLIIYLNAVADNCPFDQNSDETEYINYYIYSMPECADGVDNDGDGYIDYPADFGCSSPSDNSEINGGNFQCNNGIDDDLDSLIDQADPMCIAWNDDNEFSECNDAADNDGDGWVDMIDPGCSSPNDDDESDYIGNTECSDQVDNDGDTLIDGNDPGCTDPSDDDESDLSQCSDGVDNDGDGYIDYPADFGCSSAIDDSEINDGTYECNDGLDNDLDSYIDQEDPNCDNWYDDDESEPIITCTQDIDCGEPTIVSYCDGLTYYSGGNTPICLNPGTEQSYCVATGLVVPTQCSYICSDTLGCDYTQCSDGVDNDGDGYIDYPDDWGCTDIFDDNEINEGIFECNNGIDDDSDGFIDMDDPDCDSPTDDTEGAINCTSDTDCGNNTFYGDAFCKSDDVFRNFRFYTCKNPGTVYSYCEARDEEAIFESCSYGCKNAKCSEKKETPLNEDLYVSDITLGLIDRFFVKDEVYFSVTLKNDGKTKLEDLKVSLVVYDLGVYYSFGNFDLKEGERATKSRAFEMPYDIKKGKYDVRLVISNDDIRRVIHREVTIV